MQEDAVEVQKDKSENQATCCCCCCSKPVASSENRAQMMTTGSMEAPLSLLSDREESKGEIPGDVSDFWGDNWQEDDCLVDFDALDLKRAAGCGMTFLVVPL